MIVAVAALICTGAAGAALFTTGIILSITPLVAGGIALTAFSVGGMLVAYVYCQPPQQQTQTQQPQQNQSMPIYSTNNMSTMKRNKSDTDLELINRQTNAYDSAGIV